MQHLHGVLAGVVVAVGCLSLGGCRPAAQTPAAVPAAPAVSRLPYDPRQISQTVAFWEGQVRRDPQGQFGMTQLAGAYLQRQRETGDDSYAVRAETVMRRALKLLPGHPGMILRLGRSLLAQHRFREALACADKVVKYDPEAHRLRADALLELGRYDEAGKAVARIPKSDRDAGMVALHAQHLALRGHVELALKSWDDAVALAGSSPELSAENVAWFHVRRAAVLVAAGRLDVAEKDYLAALELFPGDYRAMEGLVNLLACRHDWQRTAMWGEKLLPYASDPDNRALLGEAYSKTNREKQARQQFALATSDATQMLKSPGTHGRHLALYLADTGQHLPEALRIAQSDLKHRGDIYTWDTVAWTCFKNQRLDEAKKAADKALALGTRDAILWYHAGEIAAARGDKKAARKHLETALEINDQFHPVFPGRARRILNAL